MNNNIAIPIEVSQKIAQYEQFAYSFKDCVITSNEELVNISDQVKIIKQKKNDLEELRKSMTKPLDESKTRIIEFFRKPIELLTKVESAIKSAISKFQYEQERLRQEEERRLREARDREVERLQKRAEIAEGKGKTDKAEEIQARIDVTKAISIEIKPAIQKIEGVTTRKIWKFRIANELLIPREYLIPDEKKLGEMARNTKGTVQVPGIEFYSEDSIAVR